MTPSLNAFVTKFGRQIPIFIYQDHSDPIITKKFEHVTVFSFHNLVLSVLVSNDLRKCLSDTKSLNIAANLLSEKSKILEEGLRLAL